MVIALVLIVIDLVILFTCYYTLGVKVRCPKCLKEQRSFTYRQLGVIIIALEILSILTDLITGDFTVSYFNMIFWLIPAYFIFNKPSFFCRHCFEEIPLKDEYLTNKPFFY